MIGDVIEKAVAVADIAARDIGLVLDDRASIGQEAVLGSLNAVHGYFEDWTNRGPLLDEEGDVFAVKADHVGLFTGYFKTKVFDIKGGGALGILRLDQDVTTEGVGHGGFLAAAKIAADE
jgi:hypothetical protein